MTIIEGMNVSICNYYITYTYIYLYIYERNSWVFLFTRIREENTVLFFRRMKELKCPLGALHLVRVPGLTQPLSSSPHGAGAGILLFSSSVHLQTPNWAATLNTRINHPCSGGL